MADLLTVGGWHLEFFSKLMIFQKPFEISLWNFQHMLIIWVPYFWHKNFGHFSRGIPEVPSIRPILWTPLAAIIFEIFSKKCMSSPMAGIWNIPKKMAFSKFLHSCTVQVTLVILVLPTHSGSCTNTQTVLDKKCEQI